MNPVQLTAAAIAHIKKMVEKNRVRLVFIYQLKKRDALVLHTSLILLNT